MEIRRNSWTQPPGTQEGIREMASEGRPCVCSCPNVGGCPRVSSRVHACVFAWASECGTPCMFMSVSPCVHTCIHVCVPVVSCGVPGIWVTYPLSPTVCPCVPASVCVHVGLGASRVWRLGQDPRRGQPELGGALSVPHPQGVPRQARVGPLEPPSECRLEGPADPGPPTTATALSGAGGQAAGGRGRR